VLLFDEASSALDHATEQAVMQAIDGLSRELTVVMIAHRLTSLKGCDRVIELSAGRVMRELTGLQVASSLRQ
jgi:ATP-binding cassette subfamily B protein